MRRVLTKKIWTCRLEACSGVDLRIMRQLLSPEIGKKFLVTRLGHVLADMRRRNPNEFLVGVYRRYRGLSPTGSTPPYTSIGPQPSSVWLTLSAHPLAELSSETPLSDF